MKLSVQMRALFDMHLFNFDMCKLIGEFAGFDVPLLRGDTYYTLCSGGASYVNNNPICVNTLLGANRYVHKWFIKKRTPCSYVCDYRGTTVICHSIGGEVYKYEHIFQNKILNKRFFPNRVLDVQSHLKEYINQPFQEIDVTRVEIRFNKCVGHFVLSHLE